MPDLALLIARRLLADPPEGPAATSGVKQGTPEDLKPEEKTQTSQQYDLTSELDFARQRGQAVADVTDL